jgi:hypothetical protein
MFDIHSGSPHALWYPVDCNGGSFDTLYVGQLVKAGSDGVLPLAAASGAYDTTNEAIPFGVVIGTNKRSPSYSATSLSESITSASPHANTTEFVLMEGDMIPKGDTSASVKVALIQPGTIIKGSIFATTIGTALTVGTVSTGSSTGAGFTTSAINPVTHRADLVTVYFRTGGNKGIYRVTTDASTTVKTVEHYFPYDIAVGDTVVGVPLRVGYSKGQTDTESVFINGAADPATDHWGLNVLWLDLSVAGKECVYFQFGHIHFVGAARA